METIDQGTMTAMAGDHITDPNMPDNLRALAARVEAGEDPDAVKGIEQLWLYRAERDREKFDASQDAFFDKLRESSQGP